ncbi:SDR family NAD(P)-dependent oxidoreductase [Burkholderia gladioli]|uniref:SDR family NAD(P)-dependent oxidoreductase n=1 Tax=Burkholderia gladioli TaxID=28095 RepID=UPI000F800604|nr:SDR family oxidoreductase [Burkholderia gladioli]MBU9641150.1 SDR family oxidoreductase [Burkholderia gladioli]MDN7807380.1 SDR family oxidoreductase [Burkholderia gladioli]
MVTPTDTHPRVALITGAAGGLGEAFALQLAASGHELVLTDREPCHALVERIRSDGGRASTFACDLGVLDEVERLASRVLGQHHAIDILVNNAAYMPQASLADTSAQLWRRIMTVNVDAPFLLARALSPDMIRRRWGRIVNLASSSVWGPPPGMTAYVSSKMAVIGLTRALASELGAHGITVNAIAPGLTRHPGSAANMPPIQFEAVRARQFIPRTETPDDLTGTLAFLVSDAAAFITAQVVNVDGGGFGF